jgi:hypothetical protein
VAGEFQGVALGAAEDAAARAKQGGNDMKDARITRRIT